MMAVNNALIRPGRWHWGGTLRFPWFLLILAIWLLILVTCVFLLESSFVELAFENGKITSFKTLCSKQVSPSIYQANLRIYLGRGFTHCWFSSLLGEMIHFENDLQIMLKPRPRYYPPKNAGPPRACIIHNYNIAIGGGFKMFQTLF